MSNGWIKIDRSLLTHWVFSDSVILKAWLDILLTANHTDTKIMFDGNLMTIERGQHMTSIRKLAERWSCSREKVSRTLKCFSDEKMIEVKAYKKGTLLTVVNYGKYQDVQDTEKPQKRHRKDTEWATESHQTRMNKNEYKNEEEKETASGENIFDGLED